MPEMAAGGNQLPSPPHCDCAEFAKTHPRLAEAFVASVWSDGSPKKPARLSLGIYGRRWIAQLDLVGTGLMLRVEIPDPVLIYDALEGLLNMETVPWEKNPYLDAKPAGKAKKG